MGANLSMPDGSDVKAPEGRIEHDAQVRANCALVFVKPAACTSECCNFVRGQLLKQGVVVLGECYLDGPAIEAGGLIDKHYAEIAEAAMSTNPADLEVSEEKKAAFESAFGMCWDKACEDDIVVNAQQALRKLGEDDDELPTRDLAAMWSRAPTKVKLCSGAYVAKIRGGGKGSEDYKERGEDDDDEEEEDDQGEQQPPLFVVDGFYPHMRESYVKPETQIKLYCVCFDPTKLKWSEFRASVIGATDPAKAAPGSIRRLLSEKWESLKIDKAPDNTDNGVHASAGPLEGLKERITWLDFPLDQDPTGHFLSELAVWDDCSAEGKTTIIQNLLNNPAGKDGQTAFDATEDADTSDLYVFANNLAFATELQGFI